MTNRRPGGWRLLLPLAAVSLLAALWGGLVRLGWRLPVVTSGSVVQHGGLLIAGFLGTVIALERAVALRYWGAHWSVFLAPLLSGLGGLALLAGLSATLGRGLIALGALGLVILLVAIVRRQPDLAHRTMALGALLWLAGSILWLVGWPVSRVVPWWAGFLVLTIAGERWELARLGGNGRWPARLFGTAVAGLLVGLVLSLVAAGPGMRLAGLGFLALGLWLLRYDLARRTIRRPGLTRFIAACLLPGYGWLAVAGLLWLVYGARFSAGPIYDAQLHSLFLGFVISMIFGHVLIILPAVTGLTVHYHRALYLPLGLLHLSLLLRVAGDLAGRLDWRQWGGLFNVLSILLLAAILAYGSRNTPGTTSRTAV